MIKTNLTNDSNFKKPSDGEKLFHVHIYRLDDNNSYFSTHILGTDRQDILSKLKSNHNLDASTYDVVNIKPILEFENHLINDQLLFHAHFFNSKSTGFDIHKHFFAFSLEDAQNYLHHSEGILINSYHNFYIEQINFL